MDSYVKRIDLHLEIDKSSLRDVESTLNELAKGKLVDEESVDKLKAQLDMLNEAKQESKKLQEKLDAIKDLQTDEAKEIRKSLEEQLELRQKDIDDLTTDKDKPNIDEEADDFEKTLATFKKGFGTLLLELGKKFLQKLGELFKDAWAELNNMLQYSLLSNQNTRDLAFTYGFSASEAYGFDKAKSLLGVNDIEDLYYMNDQQRGQFTRIFEKFSDKYSKLYDEGFFDTFLDYQIEMEEFKEDLKLEVIEFFMNNKDLIKSGMLAIMELAKGALEFFGWIVDTLNQMFGTDTGRSNSERIAATNDIINNSSVRNNTTNVTIDNTFNNVQKSDQSWLANAGQMTYQQIITALSGN